MGLHGNPNTAFHCDLRQGFGLQGKMKQCYISHLVGWL